MSEREVNELFAKNLTRLLKEHDLSQAQFGSIIGVTQQAISRWMSARVFPVAYLLIFKGFCKQCVSSNTFVSSKKYLPSRCHSREKTMTPTEEVVYLITGGRKLERPPGIVT